MAHRVPETIEGIQITKHGDWFRPATHPKGELSYDVAWDEPLPVGNRKCIGIYHVNPGQTDSVAYRVMAKPGNGKVFYLVIEELGISIPVPIWADTFGLLMAYLLVELELVSVIGLNRAEDARSLLPKPKEAGSAAS